MKASDFRVKTSNELIVELESLDKELFNLRMQKNSSEAPVSRATHNFKQARRKRAQIKTILNERRREQHHEQK